MPPEECKEVEHEQQNSEDSSFTKEVFQEAFGELYTEHVKITLKPSDISAFPCQDQRIPSVSTFKKTYFGATKSQSMNENLTLKDEELTLENEGRTKPILGFIVNK